MRPIMKSEQLHTSEFPANYEKLNWCIKTAILDPINLAVWSSRNYPRIVPLEADAREIGLAHNWQTFLDDESRLVIAGESNGRGDFAVLEARHA